MSTENTGKKQLSKGMAYVTVCLISFILLGTNAVNPALKLIGETWGLDPVTQSLFSQIPNATAIPFVLLGGAISQAFSKKNVALVGIALYTIGGSAGLWAPSFEIILGGRCLLGFGIGLLNPVVIGMIADMFKDDNDNYTRLVGLNTTFKSLGGMFNTMVVGFLVAISWRMAFVLYLIGILAFLFTLFAVPNIKPERKTKEERAAEKANKERATWRDFASPAYILLLFMILFEAFATSSANTNTTNMIADAGFGGTIFAGIALSCYTLAAVISSAVFAAFGPRIKSSTWSSIGMAAIVAGCLIAAFPVHPVQCLLGPMGIGFGNGLMRSSWGKQATLINIKWAALLFAVWHAVSNLSTTLQTLIVPPIAIALGGPGLGALNFLIIGVIEAVIFVINIFAQKYVISPTTEKAEAEMAAQKAAEEAAKA